ncbi:hypothetical protein AVEN_214960-1 [Araneus ventricosus]|uniref:Uncharacterized protein n=1 Tax=Araneus ventricosus TaxID=182803 RepID=A0A4Y2VRH9_ARAVE|nr:hypothetical protein AVEN_214960-1 [Araneus ventricosus]
MTSNSFTIVELEEEKLTGANLSDDSEVVPPFLKDAMGSIGKLSIYFFCQRNGERTLNELNSIHNHVVNTHIQSARQTMVQDFLNETPTCMHINRIGIISDQNMQ